MHFNHVRSRTSSLVLLSLIVMGCDDGESGGVENNSDDNYNYDDNDDLEIDEDDNNGPVNTVVGGWWTRTENIEVGWFLCEDHRMRGFSKMGGYEFLDKGTWSGSTDIVVKWSSKDTIIGDTWGPDSATFRYDPIEDTLCCFDNTFMVRLEGEVSNSNCNSAW